MKIYMQIELEDGTCYKSVLIYQKDGYLSFTPKGERVTILVAISNLFRIIIVSE